ncbi:MAG: hypothetical protein M1127_03495 [Patescibacteria group bacterium]|nr:hypothetical protein [Patescibacteria group bacterium]
MSGFEKPKEKADERTVGLAKEIFNSEKALDDLRQELSVPDRKIGCSFDAKVEKVIRDGKNEFGVLQVRIYLAEKTDNAPRQIGYFSFSFGKHHAVSQELYIEFNELIGEKQDKGLGLELECKIENFCRSHNIWDIYNTATSAPAGVFGESRFIGGYFWARMGFDFDEFKESTRHRIESWRKDLIEFAQNKKIDILFDPLELTMPFEFAGAMGLDEDNHIVSLGKKFFIEGEIKWFGHKDLRFNSQCSRDFVGYLMLRNRFDLLEEYFIEPLDAERDKEFIDYLAAELAEKGKADLFTKYFPQILEKDIEIE